MARLTAMTEMASTAGSELATIMSAFVCGCAGNTCLKGFQVAHESLPVSWTKIVVCLATADISVEQLTRTRAEIPNIISADRADPQFPEPLAPTKKEPAVGAHTHHAYSEAPGLQPTQGCASRCVGLDKT